MTQPSRWRKSSYSNDSATCVEIADTRNAVRDSKNPNGPQLSTVNVLALLDAIKSGRYDPH